MCCYLYTAAQQGNGTPKQRGNFTAERLSLWKIDTHLNDWSLECIFHITRTAHLSTITFIEMILWGDLFFLGQYRREEWLQQPVTISAYIWECQYCIKIDLKEMWIQPFKGAWNTTTERLQKINTMFPWQFANGSRLKIICSLTKKVQELPLIIPHDWKYTTTITMIYVFLAFVT